MSLRLEDHAWVRPSWLAGFVGIDGPATSTLTRELLGWHPTGPGLVEDLNQGHHFDV